MADVDAPPEIDPVVPPTAKTAGSLLERWVETGPEQALARVDALVKTLETLRLASIRATYPSDWIVHTTVDRETGVVTRQVGYLQDCGAERAGKVWGIEVGQPIIDRENHPDGTFSYHMLADGWSKVTGERTESAEGSRWSGSKFFERSVGPDEKVDPTNVRKAAFANLHGRIVRSLGGLSAVPLDVLRAAGLDLGKVLMIGYEKGARGGESAGASVGTTDVTVAFGNSRGAKPVELADKDLDWYIKAYTENVSDEKKARFRAANQRVLDALVAEKGRRAQSTAHEAETGTKAPDPEAEVPTNRGQKRGRKLGDLNTRLSDAAHAGGIKITVLVKALTKDLLGAEIAALSDLTDEHLDTLNGVPESVLADTAKLLAKAAAE